MGAGCKNPLFRGCANILKTKNIKQISCQAVNFHNFWKVNGYSEMEDSLNKTKLAIFDN